ncbi:putative Heatr6 protein [Paratrimastix pyriformis]|uniref:Heatr6 protein n=1 Tax=Paratrimastix pyriformis TaxID=342808 RepID=A0ABQ8UNM1_9EUKA|nr:putative Heatr6 protein [Paratrimastix pyriformis]
MTELGAFPSVQNVHDAEQFCERALNLLRRQAVTFAGPDLSKLVGFLLRLIDVSPPSTALALRVLGYAIAENMARIPKLHAPLLDLLLPLAAKPSPRDPDVQRLAVLALGNAALHCGPMRSSLPLVFEGLLDALQGAAEEPGAGPLLCAIMHSMHDVLAERRECPDGPATILLGLLKRLAFRGLLTLPPPTAAPPGQPPSPVKSPPPRSPPPRGGPSQGHGPKQGGWRVPPVAKLFERDDSPPPAGRPAAPAHGGPAASSTTEADDEADEGRQQRIRGGRGLAGPAAAAEEEDEDGFIPAQPRRLKPGGPGALPPRSLAGPPAQPQPQPARPLAGGHMELPSEPASDSETPDGCRTPPPPPPPQAHPAAGAEGAGEAGAASGVGAGGAHCRAGLIWYATLPPREAAQYGIAVEGVVGPAAPAVDGPVPDERQQQQQLAYAVGSPAQIRVLTAPVRLCALNLVETLVGVCTAGALFGRLGELLPDHQGARALPPPRPAPPPGAPQPEEGLSLLAIVIGDPVVKPLTGLDLRALTARAWGGPGGPSPGLIARRAAHLSCLCPDSDPAPQRAAAFVALSVRLGNLVRETHAGLAAALQPLPLAQLAGPAGRPLLAASAHALRLAPPPLCPGSYTHMQALAALQAARAGASLLPAECLPPGGATACAVPAGAAFALLLRVAEEARKVLVLATAPPLAAPQPGLPTPPGAEPQGAGATGVSSSTTTAAGTPLHLSLPALEALLVVPSRPLGGRPTTLVERLVDLVYSHTTACPRPSPMGGSSPQMAPAQAQMLTDALALLARLGRCYWRALLSSLPPAAPTRARGAPEGPAALLASTGSQRPVHPAPAPVAAPGGSSGPLQPRVAAQECLIEAALLARAGASMPAPQAPLYLAAATRPHRPQPPRRDGPGLPRPAGPGPPAGDPASLPPRRLWPRCQRPTRTPAGLHQARASRPTSWQSRPAQAPPGIPLLMLPMLPMLHALRAVWLEVGAGHLWTACSDPDVRVQAAACAAYFQITPAIYDSLLPLQRLIRPLVLGFADRDHALLLRAAACRVLGMLATFPSVRATDTLFLVDCVYQMRDTATDANLNLRTKAHWALANTCEALRFMAPPAMPANTPHVRTSAVRALGNLARLLFEDPGAELLGRMPPEMVVRMLGALTLAARSGSVKIRWNACYALGPSWQPRRRVQRCPNYKVRIHAAATLACPPTRAAYGCSFVPVFGALLRALEGIEGEAPDLAAYRYQGALHEQLLYTACAMLALKGLPDTLPPAVPAPVPAPPPPARPGACPWCLGAAAPDVEANGHNIVAEEDGEGDPWWDVARFWEGAAPGGEGPWWAPRLLRCLGAVALPGAEGGPGGWEEAGPALSGEEAGPALSGDEAAQEAARERRPEPPKRLTEETPLRPPGAIGSGAGRVRSGRLTGALVGRALETAGRLLELGQALAPPPPPGQAPHGGDGGAASAVGALAGQYRERARALLEAAAATDPSGSAPRTPAPFIPLACPSPASLSTPS